mmetsp:Transcript_15073/g.45548  ORF Transcript_15073/g.45548 Transcript_15073/m.45548 type:complete len:228 (+) Transcript_15073:349-1032(+)
MLSHVHGKRIREFFHVVIVHVTTCKLWCTPSHGDAMRFHLPKLFRERRSVQSLDDPFPGLKKSPEKGQNGCTAQHLSRHGRSDPQHSRQSSGSQHSSHVRARHQPPHCRRQHRSWTHHRHWQPRSGRHFGNRHRLRDYWHAERRCPHNWRADCRDYWHGRRDRDQDRRLRRRPGPRHQRARWRDGRRYGQYHWRYHGRYGRWRRPRWCQPRDWHQCRPSGQERGLEG